MMPTNDGGGVGAGEAPGRLDALGGVADYSGALVLQTPIRATTRVEARLGPASPDPVIRVDSAGFAPCEAPRADVLPAGLADDAEADARLRGAWDAAALPGWARYCLGCLSVFSRAKGWSPPAGCGVTFTVATDVPLNAGVSSSAALEIATLRALAALAGPAAAAFTGTEIARLAQRAENHLVGAPCGLMDQLASAFARPGALLPILCRPDELRAPIDLPPGVQVVGWPSGVKHAVVESPYGTARAAAFMGRKILEARLRRPLTHLTELTPSELRDPATGRSRLPETLSGGDFLQTYEGVDDPLTRLEAGREYPVRAATHFAVGENFRSQLVVGLLEGAGSLAGGGSSLSSAGTAPEERRARLGMVGELFYLAHAGYGAMGLGCPETDAMVDLCRRLGPGRGVYGARVSGGGSGGTVAVLLDGAGRAALEEARRRQPVPGVPELPLID